MALEEENQLVSTLFGSSHSQNKDYKKTDFEFELVEDKESNEKSNHGAGVDEKEQELWRDPDDETCKFDISENKSLKRLRETVEETFLSGADITHRIKQKTKRESKGWIRAFEQVDNQNDLHDSIFKTDSSLISKIPSEKKLIARNISITPTEFNPSLYRGAVGSMDWHQSYSILATTSRKRRLVKIFDIDGSSNKLLYELNLPFIEEPTVKFYGSKHNRYLVTGKNKHFFSVDLSSSKIVTVPFISGQREAIDLRKVSMSPLGDLFAICSSKGKVLILNQRNNCFVNEIRIKGTSLCSDFTSCGNYLLVSGSQGKIYKWDIRKFKRISYQDDYARIKTTCIQVNPQNDNVYATAGTSGVVNVYNTSSNKPQIKNIKPIKEALNIRNEVNSLKFNQDGTLLAYASEEEYESIKLMCMNDLAIIPSFPRVAYRVGKVTCLGFSSDNKYLALGNAAGRCLLYRVKNYL